MSLELLVKAYHFAAVKHRSQRRKDPDATPYINHPTEVAQILMSCDITDYKTLIAGILHDTIEDTKTTYDELVTEFGKDIADIVQECTDDKSLAKILRKKAQIEHSKSISKEAKCVKLADKYSNLLSLEEHAPKGWSPEQTKGYFYWGFAVCSNLYGINKKLDNNLQTLFKKHNITDTQLSEKLEEYYKTLADQN